MKAPRSGGGWKAIVYSLRLARGVGPWRFWKAMRSKNACKTCAVGMGGQLGGMVNEGGLFPEVCKKSFQAMASDMQGAIKPAFFARYGVRELKALSPRELEASGRLVDPLYLGPGETHYRVIGWEEAIGRVADRLGASGPEKTFYYCSGRSSNEAGFLLQLLARVQGTNYVNNCSYYCHQASGVGLASSIGGGVATIRWEDLHHCDLYVLIGANPASNHPRLMRNLMEIRRRGGKVIVINPLRELGLVNFRVPSDTRSMLFGSEIASLYVQPHIGGDTALLTGVAKAVLDRGKQDDGFIAEATEGFGEFKQQVEQTTWEEIVASSGVDRKTIEQVADAFCEAKNAVLAWAMGITHHKFGVQNVQMIASLALLRGMIGRPHAGLMPIRGHSNVQGIGSVGVTPTLKKEILERFEKKLGLQVPQSPGLDTMACMEAADAGEMETALCLGGNLYGSNPDSQFATRAISKLRQVCYLSTTLNTGHAWGGGQETLILPVLPRDEEPQPTTQESMFSFVRLSEGGKPRHTGPRSEVSILTELGRRVFGEGGPIDWRKLESHAAVRQLIGELIPGYEDAGTIDATKKEFHVGGRAIYERKFPTPTGKARFHAVALPEPPEENELRLMTIRSEGQFNTVVYDEEDLYRGQERRDVILMSREDMNRLGLKPDDRVRIQSAAGEMRHILARPFDVRPGNVAMYCPEANILVPKGVDPKSKTPSFKLVPVTVEAEEAVASRPASELVTVG
ncbi:MAG: FdhF/YdeP family oxidoreductase [Planctomycetaceae bacterium]